MSGFPGRFFTFFRNLNPLENRNFLTIISGFVSLEDTLAIISLLFSLVKISIYKSLKEAKETPTRLESEEHILAIL